MGGEKKGQGDFQFSKAGNGVLHSRFLLALPLGICAGKPVLLILYTI